jgi:hypothetical protein
MKRRVVIVFGFLAVALAGCGSKTIDKRADEGDHGEHQTDSPGITFKAGKGLRIAPDTAKFIGLRVADVTDRKISSGFSFAAQVYRSSRAVHSASVNPPAASTAMVSATLSEADATKVRRGAILRAQNKDGAKFEGLVAELKYPLGTNAAQVEVILALADPKGQLKEGTILTVHCETTLSDNAVAVPISAILRTVEGTFIYTVSGDRFIRTPVTLGLSDGEFVETLDGLYTGDQVVVEAVKTLWMAELQSIRGGKSCSDD